jgi:hypothetical protein
MQRSSRRAQAALGLLLAMLLVAGCGSSKKSNTSAQGGGATKAAEAKSLATGDIPDNQVFLTFHNAAAGYSILYPEGWARKGSGNDVTLQDKDNQIHIVVGQGKQPTVANVKAELAKLKASSPALKATSAQQLTIRGKPVIKVSYTSESAPNPVTGKRVKLIVDRYVYFNNGKVATVDLGTAVGVDNVDAYKMIARSFRWQ